MNERAQRLCATRECPHCGEVIALEDAISMVQGSGLKRYVMVESHGYRHWVDLSHFNPQTMTMVSDADEAAATVRPSGL